MSHAAAIRVPFPDSSAVEPSGFQITISTAPSSDADDLDDPVRAARLLAHELRRQLRLLGDEVDVPVCVPA